MADTYALLNVVETNPFKHLIHLSLRVLPGNDTAIKSFLAECLREYKLKTERLEKSLQSTSGSLTSSLNSVQQVPAVNPLYTESVIYDYIDDGKAYFR